MSRATLIVAVVSAAVILGGGAYLTFYILEQPVPETSTVSLDATSASDTVGTAAPATQPVAAPVQGGVIQVQLYVLSSSGTRLETESQEVQLAESLQKQCRQVIELLLSRSAAVPEGVELREVFITSQGVAFVDLSQELVANHPGGSSAEELTVFGLSSTLIANFPAIKMVKILVEGREVQSLAGHLDLTIPYGRAPAYLNPPPETSESPNNETN